MPSVEPSSTTITSKSAGSSVASTSLDRAFDALGLVVDRHQDRQHRARVVADNQQIRHDAGPWTRLWTIFSMASATTSAPRAAACSSGSRDEGFSAGELRTAAEEDRLVLLGARAADRRPASRPRRLRETNVPVGAAAPHPPAERASPGRPYERVFDEEDFQVAGPRSCSLTPVCSERRDQRDDPGPRARRWRGSPAPSAGPVRRDRSCSAGDGEDELAAASSALAKQLTPSLEPVCSRPSRRTCAMRSAAA